MNKAFLKAGFTLIELSIVLVIIGLIVGGVLVGQDLIRAAAVRAQVSQIEKYNTAVNTFYGKYGYLPGNITPQAASQYGFSTRINGVGNGTGIILGGVTGGFNLGWTQGSGETMLFWTDLSTAGLIDGGFTLAASPGAFSQGEVTVHPVTATSTPPLSAYYPFAKIGGGNYIYVWSGGPYATATNGSGAGTMANSDGNNYFGIEVVTSIYNGYALQSNSPGLTVSQAYNMDTKMDDGLPTSGRVTVSGINGANAQPSWLGGNNSGYGYGGPNPGTATQGGPTTCYDNGNNGSNPMQYSMSQSNGAYVNCALSFAFQ